MATLPVTITPRALEEIKNIQQTKGIPENHLLRLASRGGGCSGFQLYLGFDVPQPDDERFEHQGLQVLVDKKHYMHLAGATLDYEIQTHAQGFVFK